MLLNKKKYGLWLTLLGVLLLALNISGLQAQDDMVLRVGMPGPSTLDPAIGANDHEVIINRHIYDYLVELTPSGDLVPSLAESWDISDDGLTFTFNLVEGVTFHDGSDFTSADVVYTFNRLAEVGSSAMGLLGQEVVGEDDEGNSMFEPTFTVSAVDDLTVEFQLNSANADFLYGVASRFAPILPEGLNTPNSLEAGEESFNGTGPFQLGEFDAGESVTLVANDNYWGDTPELDAIEFVFIEDQNAQVDALRSGQVDFIFKVPTELLPNLESEDGVTLTTVATNTHPVIRLRADEGSLGEDVRIRQAFKHATDRELLNLDALDGLGTVGNNDPIGPVYGALYGEVDSLEYSPQMACDLLAEYATDNPDNEWVTLDGSTPTLSVDFYVVDALGYPIMAEFIQQQWEEGCIDVELIVQPENIYYDVNWLDVDLGVTGWGTRPTPQEYLNVAYITGAPFNESHWSNAQLDELAAAAAAATTVEERAEIYDEIRVIFEQEGPIIIPYFRPIHGAYASNVSGLSMHSFPGRTDLDGVTVGN